MFGELTESEIASLKRELELAYYHLKQGRDLAKELIKQNWVPKFVKTAQRVIIKRNQGIMEEIHNMMGEF